MPSILGLGAGLAAMGQLGFFDAMKLAMSGNLQGAGNAIISRMTTTNMISAAILPIGLTVVRKFMPGGVTLFNVGKFRVRLL
jgi:hypothetical protein